MKSDYERTTFRGLYWTVAGILLAISFVLLIFIGISVSGALRVALILIGVSELVAVIMLFILADRMMGEAYSSVENVTEMMTEMIENDGEYETNDKELREGSIGDLYNIFDKLVNMFREGKKRESLEKERLQEVMSDISHQLKTPLASMSVFLDLLIDDKVGSEEERKKFLVESKNQIDRMEWMVLSMLKLARIEAGAVSFEIGEVSLSTIIGEAVGSVSYLTEGRGQTITVDCPEDVKIKADGQWLTEAVINILKNASDYSAIDNMTDGNNSDKAASDKAVSDKAASDYFNDEKKRRIEIYVEKNSVFTRINIRDHGMGMTEETMTHIFERFYRASSGVNPNSVGIGLSLSKSIVEEMNGRITVDSTLGEGSIFKIQFETI